MGMARSGRGGGGGIVIPVSFSFQLARDLLHPSPEEERRKHKLKRLVQSPNSYFMDVKCPGWSVRVCKNWCVHVASGLVGIDCSIGIQSKLDTTGAEDSVLNSEVSSF